MESSESMNKYKCENLFLLIGSNPLPNYVAARLLLKPIEKEKSDKENRRCIYLIFSEGVKEYAAHLQETLEDELKSDFPQLKFEPIKVSESNPRDIRDEIKRKFPEELSNGTIGLHYTGGTKAMAVHSYLQIKELCDKYEAHFSYLNSRDLELILDPPEGKDTTTFKLGDPNDLADRQYFTDARIGLTQILRLHGLEPRQPRTEEKDYFKNPRTSAWLFDLAKCLFEIAMSDDDLKKWRDWSAPDRHGIFAEHVKQCGQQNKYRRNEFQRQKYRQCLQSQPVPLPALPKLVSELRNLNLVNSTHELVLSAYPRQYNGKYNPPVDYFCEWLQGKWLEDYVLQQVLDIQYLCSLHDCGGSLEPAKSKTLNREPFFELDVVALRGYQLFAFSCTTDSRKKEVKLKLFEAYVRARQLGGDEARVALVCMNTEPRELERELEQEWSVEKNKVKVFGKSDLKNDFQIKLKDWFEGK